MPDQVLQDIKDRLDIAEVIGGYIQIRKSGANFKAVCPFHNEKSASLMISAQKQIWHCFGCGEGGDVFGFVMRYENLEFREALKLLAQRAGVPLPEYNARPKGQEDEREQLLKINDFAARFYHEILIKDPRAEAARAYVRKRGLSEKIVAQWKIGFAPDEFHALEQALGKKGVAPALMVRAGVSVKNERGQMYDRFRGRITFPIFNTVGEAVGFSARIMPGAENSPKETAVAKYINSPETPVYSKGSVLFGFSFAKAAIRKADEVVIVEGQMDAISAHQAGFANVVASSGTALTPPQLTLLSRFTKNLKFCFDADAAGLLATKRAVEQYLGRDFIIKIVELAGAKDPDELIRKNPGEFARAVEQAPLFLDFFMQRLFQDFEPTMEKKREVSRELLPLLAGLSDPLEQDHYLHLLANRLDTTPHVLLESIHKLKGKAVVQPKAAESRPAAPIGVNSLEKQVLGGMLLYPSFRSRVIEQGRIEDFSHPDSRALAGLLWEGKDPDASDLLAKEAIFMVESQMNESDGGSPAVLREMHKAFALLRLSTIKDQQKDLNSRIKNAEEQKQKETVSGLNRQFMELSKLRVELERLL